MEIADLLRSSHYSFTVISDVRRWGSTVRLILDVKAPSTDDLLEAL